MQRGCPWNDSLADGYPGQQPAHERVGGAERGEVGVPGDAPRRTAERQRGGGVDEAVRLVLPSAATYYECLKCVRE